MQLAVHARREEGKRLTPPIADGLRGVGKDTVRNDLASLSPKSGEKIATRALLSQSDQNDWRTPRKYPIPFAFF